MMFLSERRRIELIDELERLSMPGDVARRVAGYSDNLIRLDQILASIVGRLGERCHRIREAPKCGNVEKERDQETFLSCDLLIFASYRDEAIDRGLPALMFPRTTRAVAESIEQVEASKRLILQAMGKKALH